MTTFIEVAVNIPHSAGIYHYHLPPELDGTIKVGHLIQVPFGKQSIQGVVIGFIDKPEVPETKPIEALIDPYVALTDMQIMLARHLANTTLVSLAAWIELMLPPGLSQQADSSYSLGQKYPVALGEKITPLQKRILGLISQRGEMTGRQIAHALPRVNWRSAVQSLVRKQILNVSPILMAPNVRPKKERTVRLSCAPEQIDSFLSQLGRPGSEAARRRKAILEYLRDKPGEVDVQTVYSICGGTPSDIMKLASSGVISVGEREAWRDPLLSAPPQPYEAPILTQDQQTCLDEIKNSLQASLQGENLAPILLHGVTGSGKTEIYLHTVQAVLDQGRQAIVLVPEIALTPQTIQRFVGRLGSRVGLIHSRLSSGERYDTWRRAQTGEIDVIIGPRSALFTPLPRVGLIVMDECHDASYYQSEPPFYHARHIAIEYARLIGGLCLMGSATPDIESVFLAEQGKWRYLRLPDRILAHKKVVQEQADNLGGVSHYPTFEGQAETMDLPPVTVIDMRQELKSGNRLIFSRALQEALQKVLLKKQQAILFLNRRGMATYVFCRDCGAVIKCPQCDLPLTFHISQSNSNNRGAGILICHHCGYQRRMPTKCAQCGSERIRQMGTGTERVEAEVQALFPQARSLRWDYETTRQKGAHEAILKAFARHDADILIGTQMLAKGLDLPFVTLVGVVLADIGLNMPDFKAAERTFQVLTQVAGRAGRSPLGGEVILQTFEPNHYVIQAAAKHDYRSFYNQELEYRRQLKYPPFYQLLRLEYRSLDKSQAESTAQKMASQIKEWLAEEDSHSIEMIGPVPCFFEREAGYYRWQIVLRGANPVSVIKGRRLSDWRVEVDPISLL